MGGFKNQLIAQQVELGDRVPAPRPASSHTAFDTGFVSRRWLRYIERQHNEHHRGREILAVTIGLAVGVAAGFFVGVFA